jgi:hypothetical protein
MLGAFAGGGTALVVDGLGCDGAGNWEAVRALSWEDVVRKSGRIHNNTAAKASPATAHFKAKIDIDSNSARTGGGAAAGSWRDLSADTLRVPGRRNDLCIMGNSLSL